MVPLIHNEEKFHLQLKIIKNGILGMRLHFLSNINTSLKNTLFKKIPLWTQKGLAKLLAIIFYIQFYSKKEKLLNHEIHDNLVKTIFSLSFFSRKRNILLLFAKSNKTWKRISLSKISVSTTTEMLSNLSYKTDLHFTLSLYDKSIYT